MCSSVLLNDIIDSRKQEKQIHSFIVALIESVCVCFKVPGASRLSVKLMYTSAPFPGQFSDVQRTG